MSMKLFTEIVKFIDPWAQGSGTLCRANIAHSVKILNCSVTRVTDNLFELVFVRRQALSVVRIQFYFNILKNTMQLITIFGLKHLWDKRIVHCKSFEHTSLNTLH